MKNNSILNPQDLLLESDAALRNLSRRRFLNFAGGAAGVAMLAAACSKDDSGTTTPGSVSLGSGDTGILNYAYALEQLEAAFYIQVIATPYADISADEKARLTEIRDHEIAHREFFKAALGASAIGALDVNFTSIDFTKRASVLGTAKAFEDLGVSAYNGAGPLISNGDYLLLAGKIVSVEARHASYIRDMLTANSFVGADIIDGNGMEMSKTPAQVLAIAKTYVKTSIDASKLPS